MQTYSSRLQDARSRRAIGSVSSTYCGATLLFAWVFTRQPVEYRVEWPGAMTILAGIDLLAKFFAGSDERGKVTDRFRDFMEEYFSTISKPERDVVYQLRNSLLHSFGLYSEGGGKVYRFSLTGHGSGPLVSHKPPEQYHVDIRVLHREFEQAIANYQTALASGTELQTKFAAMFGKYGHIYMA